MRTSPLDHSGENARAPRFNVFFWKTVGMLTGVQIAIGIFAISMSAYFTYDASKDLIQNTIRVNLNNITEEIERRAFPPGVAPERTQSLQELPSSLILDLATRFPDPITLLDTDGNLIRTIQPDKSIFTNTAFSPVVPNIPPQIKNALSLDRVVLNLDNDQQGSWGTAPIYNASGVLVGGLLIQPLTNSFSQAFAGIQKPLWSAVFAVIGLSIITSLLLGGYFTRQFESRL